jgi:hypothetical protein
MLRRIFLICLVLGFLAFALMLLMAPPTGTVQAQALTVTSSRTPIPCGAIIVVTSTFTPTMTATATRTATATPTACGPIYITATPGGPTPTPSADITMTGYVHNAILDMLVPIAGAKVQAGLYMGRTVSATTAADGSYSLFLPGPYVVNYGANITVSAPGFLTHTTHYSEAELRANPVRSFVLVPDGTATVTATRTPPTLPAHTYTPVITSTPTRTPTGPTPTRTPTTGPTVTRTPTCACVTATPTRTPTANITLTPPPGGVCSPVTGAITAPFTYDGAGTFCWQSTNLGAYINSWNLTSLTINGFSYTNLYVAVASYPARINGYWYVGYVSAVAYGHFEAK